MSAVDVVGALLYGAALVAFTLALVVFIVAAVSYAVRSGAALVAITLALVVVIVVLVSHVIRSGDR